jgi:drug/metabolite transporter (DMT)-like permease
MSTTRISLLTLLTMLAFAGNSVLCRIALKHTAIDAASFTAIRLVSGALVLWVIASLFRRNSAGRGNWISALALFVYAAGFSFAYVSLTAATGALLLFGAVQATMIGHGLWGGERLQKWQLLGLMLAFGGLAGLLLPGLAAPPLIGSVLMLIAGVAWGVYSLRGKSTGDPTRITAGNFLRAAVFAVLLGLWQSLGSHLGSNLGSHSGSHLDIAGVGYAIASGAVTSGLGYAIWYAVLPGLKAVSAATVQLSVPVIAALGGMMMLGESLTVRFVLASLAILGGIALVILNKSRQ